MDSTKKQNDDGAIIALRDFSDGFGKRQLLVDVNADFHRGELTALIGRNGSGKSTLLRAIAGLNDQYSGQIYIAGRADRGLTPERARIVAFVNTSRIRIPNMRCREIVALGRAPYTDWIGRLRDEDARVVDEALEFVGMSEFADRAIDTLSDGESQRVMIARAIAQDTPVILLDEPTSFLDLPNRYSLMALLGRLAHERGKCVVLSTHELDIALTMADRVALIDSPHLRILPADSAREAVESTFGLTAEMKNR